MDIAIWVLAGILLVSFLIQAFLVFGFVAALRSFQRPLIPDEECPKAAVLLCLRGGDPFLVHCLRGLFDQDYPNYRVVVVLDHPQDPASETLRSVLHSHSFQSIEILNLDTKEERCSLKCASLVQALEYLDGQVDFIAQLDADTIPHRTWLRELATGLAPKEVGAATGNRWYMPSQQTVGSMIRYVWNAAAVVQMYWYRIAWGGSIAVKCEAIRQAGLMERWKSALCEDTMLFQQLGKVGLKVAFVPSLMMINRETCDIANFYPWVRRQLLTARLYHPSWLAVVGHGISSAFFLIIGWLGCVVAVLMGRWWQGLELAILMVGFQMALTILLPPMEIAMRQIAKSRGEKGDWLTVAQALAWFPIVFATQWVYTKALVSCLFVKKVDWRGIEYQVDGPWGIHRLSYIPYRSVASSTDDANGKLQSL